MNLLLDKDHLFTKRTLLGINTTNTIGLKTNGKDAPTTIDGAPEMGPPKDISETKLPWETVFAYCMIALFFVLYLWSQWVLWADRRTKRKHSEEAEERMERRIEYIKDHMTIAVSFLISIAHNVCPNSCRINAFILIEV